MSKSIENLKFTLAIFSGLLTWSFIFLLWVKITHWMLQVMF